MHILFVFPGLRCSDPRKTRNEARFFFFVCFCFFFQNNFLARGEHFPIYKMLILKEMPYGCTWSVTSTSSQVLWRNILSWMIRLAEMAPICLVFKVLCTDKQVQSLPDESFPVGFENFNSKIRVIHSREINSMAVAMRVSNRIKQLSNLK